MSEKCEYCKKDLSLLNEENKSRHILKHVKLAHDKITKIKPISGFFNKTVPKQAATTNLASLIEQNQPFANIDETITFESLNENQITEHAMGPNINTSYNQLAEVLEINDLMYKPAVSKNKSRSFNVILE
jgi:hypothetical protein